MQQAAKEAVPDAAYPIVLSAGTNGDRPSWTATVEELPGCEAHGATPARAAAAAQEAIERWIVQARAEGREVPPPGAAASHSGRLLVRMPRSLHAELTRASEREGTSLNAYIVAVLSASVAWRRPGDARRRARRPTPGARALAGAEGQPRRAGARRRGRDRAADHGLAGLSRYHRHDDATRTPRPAPARLPARERARRSRTRRRRARSGTASPPAPTSRTSRRAPASTRRSGSTSSPGAEACSTRSTTRARRGRGSCTTSARRRARTCPSGSAPATSRAARATAG